MRTLKKTLTGIVLSGLLMSSMTKLDAAQYCSDVAGCGYEECCAAPNLTPAIALGAIALVAIIAVAVQNSSKGSSSAHNGSSS